MELTMFFKFHQKKGFSTVFAYADRLIAVERIYVIEDTDCLVLPNPA
jgi:hypothetical protein